MRRNVRFAGLLMLLALALGVAPLARGDAGRSRKAVAQQAYAEGKRLYDVGDYAKALVEFKRAYLSYEEPSFLFNMAQCQRAIGQKEEAIRAYKSYLRNSPDAPNAADVRRIVAELEAAVAEERRAAEANAHAATSPPTGALAPVATPAPAAAPAVSASVEAEAHAAPAPRRKTWWIWPVAGVLVAGAAVGIAVGVTQSQSKEPSLTTVRFP